MIQGHGDDRYRFTHRIRANFSSNVYSHVNLKGLKEHLHARFDVIGHYPEPEPCTLETAIAGRHGIEPAAVCATNGATEAIYLIAHAFAGSSSAILQPTFSEYADACRMYHHVLLQAERKPEPGRTIVWMCNPNNPTGSVIPKKQLATAIEKNPDTIFVIDQSYGFFTREPLLSPAEAIACPNVVQLHSMTKRFAVPGLRLGYITANPDLLKKIRAVRMPWSVNALAIEAGMFLTAHPDTAPIDLPALLAETQRLRTSLEAIPGISVEPTETHFMLCRLVSGSAAELKEWLVRTHGLLIRDAANFDGLDKGCFRIAAQTPEENNQLTAAIREWQEAHR